MSVYIDRDKIFPNGVFYVNEADPRKSLDELINRINNVPTADVLEVVRCKDCKHWWNEGYDPIINRHFGSCTCEYWEHPDEYFETADTDYCSYGERREENGI